MNKTLLGISKAIKRPSNYITNHTIEVGRLGPYKISYWPHSENWIVLCLDCQHWHNPANHRGCLTDDLIKKIDFTVEMKIKCD